MSQFNIQNSKIEQINDNGNNYKVSGTNMISETGNVVSATGNQSKLLVDRKENLGARIWSWIKGAFKWLFGARR